MRQIEEGRDVEQNKPAWVCAGENSVVKSFAPALLCYSSRHIPSGHKACVLFRD